jgi:hypothetical protein
MLIVEAETKPTSLVEVLWEFVLILERGRCSTVGQHFPVHSDFKNIPYLTTLAPVSTASICVMFFIYVWFI